MFAPFTLSKAGTMRSHFSALTVASIVALTALSSACGPAATPTPTSAPGLHVAIYDAALTALPDFTTLTPTSTATQPNFDISARAGTDHFAYTFDGFINVEADTYTFTTTSDDGSALGIDGTRLVTDDLDHPMQDATGTVDLTAGLHAIHVEYYEDTGDEGLGISWEGLLLTKEPIPDDRLFLNAT
jgi:hypothetical protein